MSKKYQTIKYQKKEYVELAAIHDLRNEVTKNEMVIDDLRNEVKKKTEAVKNLTFKLSTFEESFESKNALIKALRKRYDDVYTLNDVLAARVRCWKTEYDELMNSYINLSATFNIEMEGRNNGNDKNRN